jgi:hypothetical protein
MAYEISNYSVKVTLVAGADLSAKQYTFVKLNSSGEAIAAAAATDIPIGVLQNAPTSGQEAEVLVVGGTKLSLVRQSLKAHKLVHLQQVRQLL